MPQSSQIHTYQRALADGRTITFFDDSAPYAGGLERVGEDERPLPKQGPTGTMRFDQLCGEWVAMAPHRNARAFMPPADECPLCPTGVGTVPSEIPTSDYDVVSFGNRSPSFSHYEIPFVPDMVDAEPLFPQAAAAGHCEVLCFTSSHTGSLTGVSVQRMRTVIAAWTARTEAMMHMPGVKQVYCFENRGKEIGVTLQHPHGQMYGYPFLAPRTATMLKRAKRYQSKTGRHLLADVVAAELEAQVRVVFQSKYWVVYVPAAARWPVEMHVAPLRHVQDLAGLTAEESADLATVYLEVLGRADAYYETAEGAPVALPYVSGWHQKPHGKLGKYARLHLQLISVLRGVERLKYLAGSESGMGAFISDTTPEKIAARLREVTPVNGVLAERAVTPQESPFAPQKEFRS